MHDFLKELQSLCDRHNVKLAAGLARPPLRAILIAHRLDDAGICVETAYPDPITPARAQKAPNAKAEESKPVFGAHRHHG